MAASDPNNTSVLYIIGSIGNVFIRAHWRDDSVIDLAGVITDLSNPLVSIAVDSTNGGVYVGGNSTNNTGMIKIAQRVTILK
ncbi:hypothetical protein D3C72_2175510 [compost metagenome]